jgi:opacity protein-like surface antigen
MSMKFRVLAGLLVLFLSSALHGQVGIQSPPSRVEIFGGYSFAAKNFGTNHDPANGWNASVNFKPTRVFGIVGDLAGYYVNINFANQPFGCRCTDDFATYMAMFGPQFSIHRNRWEPFARVLVGEAHLNETNTPPLTTVYSKRTALAYAAGGGADYYVTRRIGIRGAADYLHTGIETNNPEQLTVTRNNARISTGVVFRF